LRDGENAGDLSVDEVNHETMVKLMVGRDVSQFYHHTPRPPGNVVLEVNAVRTQANPKHELSFNVRRGEIVGISGLVGAGRTELLEALFGVEPAVGGEILVDGKVVNLSDPIVAIDKGLVLVPEDRKKQGLVLEMSVRENVSLASLFRDQKRGFLNFEAEHQITSKMILRMNVKTPTHEQIVNYLSGGNQQKVVLGKWLAMNPRVLLLDEPTRGIDVGAKEEIYQLVEKLATEGVAVLFVSSEMEEVLGLSDRAIVMHEGRITGELSREELSEESVMRLATGMTSIAA
jgi:ribose transport system ATP-binding protein